ncbi:MAG TPA: hypothetical protein VGX00_06365 [Thermoplasmata archaeon]|nr:hypothetical protein [Thermoplasmata archaeon]
MSAPPGAEDPISAIFELTDRASEMAPTIRRMYRYTATVIVLFLAIMVFLLLVGLSGNLAFAVLSLIAIAFGFVALSLLVETDRFYRSFAERYRRIKLLQDAEPSPKIPTGRTPMQRLVHYLAQSNPRVLNQLHEHPESLRYRVRLGSPARPLAFDLAIIAPASAGYRWLRAGDAGFALLARLGPDAPTVADLEQFAEEVEGASKRLPARVVRAILLRLHDEPIGESVHDFAVGHPLNVAGGKVAIEIVSERPDGTYDLVPHILGVP